MKKKIYATMITIMLILTLCPCGEINANAKTDYTGIETSAKKTKKTKLNFKKATLKKGQKVRLKLINGKIKSVKSSNKKVATVTKKGVVTAKKSGKATITVTSTKNKKYTCKITVKKKCNHNKATRTVVDTPAWDETVVDQEAWDETVTIIENECGHCGQLFRSTDAHEANGAVIAHLESVGEDPSWYWQDAYDEVTHHPAVTHTVHHDAVTHEETYCTKCGEVLK